MKKLRVALAKRAGDLILLVGAAAVSVGVGMYSLPAGLISAGVLLIAGVVLSSLGGGDRE